MNMKKSSPLGAKAEIVMMGHTLPVSSNDDAKEIIEYISNTIPIHDTPDEIMKQAFQYIKNPGAVVRYIGCNVVQDFTMITLVIDAKDKDEPFEENLESRDGIFCYVYNIDAPDLSELGYCFFRKVNGLGYKRIG